MEFLRGNTYNSGMKRQRNMGRGAMFYKDNLFIILLFSIAQMFIKKEEKNWKGKDLLKEEKRH
jgi:hypothetical protein